MLKIKTKSKESDLSMTGKTINLKVNEIEAEKIIYSRLTTRKELIRASAPGMIGFLIFFYFMPLSMPETMAKWLTFAGASVVFLVGIIWSYRKIKKFHREARDIVLTLFTQGE